METEDLFPNLEEDLIIGSATTIQQIVDVLAKRGCSDLTLSMNLSAFGDAPCAGGGYCDIYRGALHNGSIVAVKSLIFYNRLEAQADSDMQEMSKRAARELYRWSKLRHHNVLPLMGLAIFRGKLSMVSEWMEHGDLMSYLRLKPDANRNSLCMDICEGLCYIHANGMVHGDLKAANVMISANGSAMIADFGNAQLKDLTLKFSNTTKSGLSVRWAAPELLLEDGGPQLSNEADVYAFGMTMLEVMTGKVPYEGTSDNRILILVAVEKRFPPRPKDLSNDLWELLNSCWDREPSKRPQVTTIKSRLQNLFWPPTDNNAEAGSSEPAVGYAPSRDSDRDSTTAVSGMAEGALRVDDNRAYIAAIARMVNDDESSLPGNGEAAPPVPVPLPPVASIQTPPAQPYVPTATKVISRDFAVQEEEEYDDSDEDSGTLWQVPIQNSTSAPSDIPSGGTPLVQRTETRPEGVQLQIDGIQPSQTDSSPASTHGGSGDVASRPPLVSHQSSRGSWDIRPRAEEVYEKLDQFFPNHDLDRPVIDGQLDDTVVATESPPVAGSALAIPITDPGVRRRRRSIRVVEAERKKMLEPFDAPKIQQ